MGGLQSSSVQAGHTIAGKYRLLRRLGQGGMGSVYLAEHLVLESQVAVKVIDTESEDTEQIAPRFVGEAKAAAALNSPHVVRIFDYGVEDGLPYMVMEVLEGESPRSRLDREQVLQPELALTVLTHVARELAKAHELGIVHRDLKPDNIFLVGSDDEILVKILDFGIAKDTKMLEGIATNTGVLLGSPFYLSPEQARGQKNTDHRADLWSLGILACECLTGQRPFNAESLGDLVLQICIEPIPPPSSFGPVPSGFDDWFAKATMRDREQRFASAKEMVTALRRSMGAHADQVGLTTTNRALRVSSFSNTASVIATRNDVTILDPQLEAERSLTRPVGLSNTTAAVTSNGPGKPRIGRGPLAKWLVAAGGAAAVGVVAILVARAGAGPAAGAALPNEGAAAKPPVPAPAPAPPPPVAEPVVATGPPPTHRSEVDAGRAAPAARRKPPPRAATPRHPAGSPKFDPLGNRF